MFESKQWNDCLLNLLANTDDEIVLRGAVIVQHLVSVNKEVAEKILETQVNFCRLNGQHKTVVFAFT